MVERRRLAWGWLAGLILVTGSARAAEPHKPVRRPWLVNTPHPAVTEDRSAESLPEPDLTSARQGFFARLALGSGVFTAGSGSSSDSRSFLGLPVSFEAYFGGTLTPYLSVGGGYARDAVGALSSSDERVDGDEPRLGDTSFYLEQLALYVSAYPSPSSPFYGYATLGLGTLNVRKSSDALELPIVYWEQHLEGADPSGPIFSLGGGYERWLNERWAIGVSGRVLAAFLSSTELGDSTPVSVLMPSVLLTFSHH